MSVGGKTVTGTSDLIEAVRSRKIGDAVELAVVRGGRNTALRATLGTQPRPPG